MGLIEVTERDGLRWVRLVDDALTEPLVRALEAALVVGEATRVVILAGQPRIFCSGASPAVIAALREGQVDPAELHLPRAVMRTEVPVIAAMAGHAIGGGLALGLSADVVLFGAESRYGATFMNHGFTPGMGSTRLLEKVMPAALAHELLLGGEPMRGVELAARGVPNVWPAGEVEARAEEVALRIADKPRRALRLLKAELARPWLEAFERAFVVEQDMHRESFAALAEERRHA
ncbi:MAG: enoyl-CoA hydratase-related protein [Polyangiaceae bacterium]